MEFSKILVPVTGTATDEETVRMACQLAKRKKSKLYAMYVITIKRSLPLEAELEPEIGKAEELMDRVERIAKEEGYKIETDLLQAREVGPAVIDEAIEKKVDLIFMGIKFKRRFGQFQLGSVVPYVLKNAPCRVILYSQ